MSGNPSSGSGKNANTMPWGTVGQMGPIAPSMGTPPPMATGTQGMFPSGGLPPGAQAPQLSGGPWNQMTQMLAGPTYGGMKPAAVPQRPVGISPGAAGGGQFGYGGIFNGGRR